MKYGFLGGLYGERYGDMMGNSMVGKKVDMFLIGYKQKAKSQKITIQPIDHKPLKASLWITQYPIQNMQKSLVLYE